VGIAENVVKVRRSKVKIIARPNTLLAVEAYISTSNAESLFLWESRVGKFMTPDFDSGLWDLLHDIMIVYLKMTGQKF